MANLLTGLRLLLIAPVCWGLAQPGTLSAWLLLAMVVCAIITDYADGKVARARGTSSARGMLFDHSTDFLFVTSGLAVLAYQGPVPTILPLLIIVAFSQYVLDSYFLFHQKQLRMSFLGRWNGVFYFVPIVLATVAVLPPAAAVGEPLLQLTTWCAWGLVCSTIASIIDRAIAPLRHSKSGGGISTGS